MHDSTATPVSGGILRPSEVQRAGRLVAVVLAAFAQMWREHNRFRIVWAARVVTTFLFLAPILLMSRAYGAEGFAASGGGRDFVTFAAVGLVVINAATRPMAATIFYLSNSNQRRNPAGPVDDASPTLGPLPRRVPGGAGGCGGRGRHHHCFSVPVLRSVDAVGLPAGLSSRCCLGWRHSGASVSSSAACLWPRVRGPPNSIVSGLLLALAGHGLSNHHPAVVRPLAELRVSAHLRARRSATPGARHANHRAAGLSTLPSQDAAQFLAVLGGIVMFRRSRSRSRAPRRHRALYLDDLATAAAGYGPEKSPAEVGSGRLRTDNLTRWSFRSFHLRCLRFRGLPAIS